MTEVCYLKYYCNSLQAQNCYFGSSVSVQVSELMLLSAAENDYCPNSYAIFYIKSDEIFGISELSTRNISDSILS